MTASSIATRAGARITSITRSSVLVLLVLATTASPMLAAEPAESPTIEPAPTTLDLHAIGAFRYQDPNYAACTSTNVMYMLNLIALNGNGGPGFRWTVTKSAEMRDRILAWERTHDTLEGGRGSDPHGWRNALNYYGWGSARLWAGKRVYEDKAYGSAEGAIRAAVRALITYRKPVGILAWSGRHAQVITGYDGLVGDPFATDAEGRYTNDFTVDAVFLTDPLKAQAMRDARIPVADLLGSANPRLRYARYNQTDSPFDDPYTPGWRRSRVEWYGTWVAIVPIR